MTSNRELNVDLDRNSFDPLYHQMYEALRGYIEDGGLRPGDRLPGEDELNELFGVSQITTRKALDILVEAGLIFRRRGKGTFVAEHPITSEMGQVTDFVMDAEDNGHVYKTTILTAEIVPVSKNTADLLKMQPGEELAMIERLRFADGLPLCLEKAFLVHRLCRGILNEDVSARPIGLILKQRYGLSLTRADQTIRAQTAGHDVARRLGIKASDPTLVVERVACSRENTPAQFARLFYRADRYALHFQLNTEQKPHPSAARGRIHPV